MKMKLSKLTAAIVGLNSKAWVATANSGIRGKNHNRVLKQYEAGTYLMSDVQYDRGVDTSKNGKKNMNILLDNGLIYPLTNIDPLYNGKGLKSGYTKIKIGRGATMAAEGAIDLHGDAPEVTEEEGQNQSEEDGMNGRALGAIHQGEKTVLAVRVIAIDGAYAFSEETLRDKVFDGPFTLASQYSACSYGQFNFQKSPNRSMTNDAGDSTTNISDGVVTVQVSTSTNLDKSIMVNDITSKITSAFGTAPSNIADYVMYCLPPDTMDGIAYAFIDSWLSVYSNEWCNYLSVQMHEVGHNLGFGHSGEGDDEYGDQSGILGYSYGTEDGPSMCLNGAKSWQTGWYQSATKVVTPVAESNSCFYGSLYGVADFELGNSAKTVIVKINDNQGMGSVSETESGITCQAWDSMTPHEHEFNSPEYNSYDLSSNYCRDPDDSGTPWCYTTDPNVEWDYCEDQPDYFVAFNRKTGINSETNEGADQVLITRAGAEGEAYSESTLVTKLMVNQSYNITNWDGTNESVTVSVESIDTSAEGFARIRIEYAGVPCESSLSPTVSPTGCSGTQIQVDIKTDNFPGETSWTLENKCTGETEESVDQNTYKKKNTLYSNDLCLSDDAEYSFTIMDTYGDGMCCGYGAGSYNVILGSEEVASGGDYSVSEIKTFGSCGAQPITSEPTSNPTKSPTNQPTAGPIVNPKQLQVIGNNGSPQSEFPLGKCQGDCDSNAECAGGLTCFQRGRFDVVPDCVGGDLDQSKSDYCI